MNTRLEQVLRELARRHATYLLAKLPADETRLVWLADGLAKNGVLVVLGEVGTRYQSAIHSWMNTYSAFYKLLAEALFSMSAGQRLGFVDQQFPPILVLDGQSAPIVEVMGGYVVPFVDYCQREREASLLELSGVMLLILEALEGWDLQPSVQNALIEEGVRLMEQMLQIGVRQYAVTSFAPPLLEQVQRRARQTQQRMPNSAPPPSTLPEEPTNGTSDTQQMFMKDQVPIFFKKGDSERMPPVRPPDWSKK